MTWISAHSPACLPAARLLVPNSRACERMKERTNRRKFARIRFRAREERYIAPTSEHLHRNLRDAYTGRQRLAVKLAIYKSPTNLELTALYRNVLSCLMNESQEPSSQVRNRKISVSHMDISSVCANERGKAKSRLEKERESSR